MASAITMTMMTIECKVDLNDDCAGLKGVRLIMNRTPLGLGKIHVDKDITFLNVSFPRFDRP